MISKTLNPLGRHVFLPLKLSLSCFSALLNPLHSFTSPFTRASHAPPTPPLAQPQSETHRADLALRYTTLTLF